MGYSRRRRVLEGATLAQLVEQLIRNQQVVGSNPTGGSKKANKVNEFFGHLDGHSVELPPIVRKLSEFVKSLCASPRYVRARPTYRSHR